MTNDIQQSGTEQKTIPFGMRLQSAREALGLERKDVAAQLRLNERIIMMMEKERYAPDLPVTFIRGYIRAYGKLLQLPESEIKKALEPIKPKASQQQAEAANPGKIPILATPTVTSGNYFMQFFTYLIICTLAGLAGMWWYNHPTAAPAPVVADNQQVMEQPQTVAANTIEAPVQQETPPLQVADNNLPLANSATAPAPQAAPSQMTEAEAAPVIETPVVTKPTPPRHKAIARAKPTKPSVEVVDLNDNDNNETNSNNDVD